MRTVTLIEGDGIGPEIAAATVRAVEAAGGKITWEKADAGAGAVEKHRDPLPQATIDSIKKNQIALKSPLATPSGGGYRSVNVTLRQHFDMYANVRPAHTLAGVPSRYTNVDLVIVRENTEDLYAGVEHYIDPRRSAAESMRPVGLAMPLPAMSGAVPWTASNIATPPSPILAAGATPRPPTRPAARSERMSPKRFIVTMTSNFSGAMTSFIAVASTIMSSNWMSG
jgi:hypothetical protein